MSLPAAFAAKVRTNIGCHVWIGATNNVGYGVVQIDGKTELAHRLAYVNEYGPIPEGMVIDHVCRVRNCVNPAHLELVTVAENNRRGRRARGLQVGEFCSNGHFVDEGDLYERASGTTECRHCRQSGDHRVNGARKRATTQRHAGRVAAELDLIDAPSP